MRNRFPRLAERVITMEVKGKLEDLMDESDWALIFDSNGRIKGVFIPEGQAEDDVPEALVQVLQAAGIDLTASAENHTIH